MRRAAVVLFGTLAMLLSLALPAQAAPFPFPLPLPGQTQLGGIIGPATPIAPNSTSWIFLGNFRNGGGGTNWCFLPMPPGVASRNFVMRNTTCRNDEVRYLASIPGYRNGGPVAPMTVTLYDSSTCGVLTRRTVVKIVADGPPGTFTELPTLDFGKTVTSNRDGRLLMEMTHFGSGLDGKVSCVTIARGV